MESTIDYFISYTSADKQKAEWIAWWIEKIGHKIKIDSWDFKPGQSFPIEMHKALRDAKKVIAILSNKYLDNDKFAGSEWASAFTSGKLLPIKIEMIDEARSGLFGSIKYIDLTGLQSRDEFIERLKIGIEASQDGTRLKPDDEPPFTFLSYEPSQIVSQSTQAISRDPVNQAHASINISRENHPEFKAGLVDKDEQARHIFDAMAGKFHIDQGGDTVVKPPVFLLYGAASQWPDALLYILYYEIKKRLGFMGIKSLELLCPDLMFLKGKSFTSNISENYLWDLLAEKLVCAPSKEEIERNLASKKAPHLFYRVLTEAESKNQQLVCSMLAAWENLTLTCNAPRHILVLFYDKINPTQSNWSFWRRKNDSLIDLVQETLRERSNRYLLPEIKSVNRRLIHEWIDLQFDNSKSQKIKEVVESKIKNGLAHKINPSHFIQLSEDDFEIHHADLKDILIETLMEHN